MFFRKVFFNKENLETPQNILNMEIPMFYNLKQGLKKSFFDFSISDICDTPPARCSDTASFSILSQIRPSDIKSYLLAIKSFTYHLKPSAIYLVGDKFTQDDWSSLETHIDNLIAIPIEEVDTGSCPHGGTWERLLSILKLTKEEYLIQIDSDTLTMSYPTEVATCVENNRSFTIGTSLGRDFISCREASEWALQFNDDTHVQTISEKSLVNLDLSGQLSYVRGCSGFAGFSSGDISVNDAELFSNSMEKLIGRAKWEEWGSEQITSNFLISNSKNKMVLPWPKYSNFKPGDKADNSTFIHFIGSTRYASGTYRRNSKNRIKILMASKQ